MSGTVVAADVTVNAETITVTGSVNASGNITLNAVAQTGTLGTPDTLPIANVATAVNINGATLSGTTVTLNASANLVSNVSNVNPPFPTVPTVPLASLFANVSAEVALTGNAVVNASGFFTAHAESNVTATVTANAVTGALGEIAIAAPIINSTARSPPVG